jgi:hypothetical protein
LIWILFTPFPPPTAPPCLAQILESHSELFFHLQQQRLIELIRKGSTEEALQFAEENLAAQGEENPKLLEELGEGICLLCKQCSLVAYFMHAPRGPPDPFSTTIFDRSLGCQPPSRPPARTRVPLPPYLPPERTIALLAFSDAKASPVGDLLDVAQRHKTAGELNGAILESQCQDKESRLPMLLKLLLWSQGQLDEKCSSYPRIVDLVTGQLSLPTDRKAS